MCIGVGVKIALEVEAIDLAGKGFAIGQIHRAGFDYAGFAGNTSAHVAIT